jgi:aryl carrier-like protein
MSDSSDTKSRITTDLRVGVAVVIDESQRSEDQTTPCGSELLGCGLDSGVSRLMEVR